MGVEIEIKVPGLGESESEAKLVAWRKQAGEAVDEDEVVAEIESDKITMEIPAPEGGLLKEIRKQAGETVTPGEIIGVIDTAAAPQPAVAKKKKAPPPKEKPAARVPPKEKAAAAPPEEAPAKVPPTAAETAKPVHAVAAREAGPKKVARRAGGRIQERVPMSGLRQAIARRLKEAQNTAAILTTFNEVNMQAVMDLRARYREEFKKKHGVDLGYMSFFVRACIEGLQRFPVVNACVDGDDIVYRNFYDIGIAVSTPRGLVVPVLRDAGALSLAEIERGIDELAQKAREGRLVPDDLKGGTFSITNGGVFGSLLSTPILNPPQSAILGMHAIRDRVVAEAGRMVIRPMMYLALSYDHRIIDGREAVQFLVTVKEALEYPGRLLLDL